MSFSLLVLLFVRAPRRLCCVISCSRTNNTTQSVRVYIHPLPVYHPTLTYIYISYTPHPPLAPSDSDAHSHLTNHASTNLSGFLICLEPILCFDVSQFPILNLDPVRSQAR
uniref:Putative secreted protein n=1 Tax=Anopheles darlingi TaxID=43151 RepID=A0A2M4D6A9_ANODA